MNHFSNEVKILIEEPEKFFSVVNPKYLKIQTIIWRNWKSFEFFLRFLSDKEKETERKEKINK